MKKFITYLSFIALIAFMVSCSRTNYDWVKIKHDKKDVNFAVQAEEVVADELPARPAFSPVEEVVYNEPATNTPQNAPVTSQPANALENNAPAASTNQQSGPKQIVLNSTPIAISEQKAQKLQNYAAKVKQKMAKKAPIKKGSYLWIGIVLLIVGLVVGLVFGGLGYVISVVGLVFLLLGLLTEVL